MAKIAVLGGGVSGLSCAHYLAKLGKKLGRSDKIILIEASNKVGGWLQSKKFDDGVIHELGPRSIRATGLSAINTLLLVEDLGLSSDLITVDSKAPAAKKRLIYVNNQLYQLPNSWKSFFFKTPPFSKPLITTLIQDLRTNRLPIEDDISVNEFMSKRFGEEVANYLADPMCRGIAAGDSRKLSMKSMFPPIFQAERNKGSVFKGMFTTKPVPPQIQAEVMESQLFKKSKNENWNVWSLKEGLEQLPQTIASNLRNEDSIELLLDHKVDHIMFKENGSSVVHVSNPTSIKPISVDHIFSALPAQSLAKCISSKTYPSLRSTLESIKSVSVAVVNLEYQGTVIPRDMGFGFLTPSITGSPILGIVFDSCCFPVHDASKDITRLTVMLGGEWFEDHFGDPASAQPETMLEAAIKAVNSHLSVKQDPMRSIVNIHKDCIPQYYLGHGSRIETIKTEITSRKLNLDILGNSFAGLGVNDSIFDARTKVENYLQLN